VTDSPTAAAPHVFPTAAPVFPTVEPTSGDTTMIPSASPVTSVGASDFIKLISRKKNRRSDLCLHVRRAATENGSQVQAYNCDDSDAQVFRFQDGQLRSKLDDNKCVRPVNDRRRSGRGLELWDCDETTTRLFYHCRSEKCAIRVDGDRRLCFEIDDRRSSRRFDIELGRCNLRRDDQLWEPEDV